VFVDGPIVMHPVDLGGSSASTSLASLGVSGADTTSRDPSVTARAWLKINPEHTAAYGLEDSLLHLRDILQRDRYDVSIFRTHVTSDRLYQL
jgi:hypothetical protein